MDSTQVEEGLLSFFLDFSIFYQKFTMNFQISGRFYFEKLSKMTKYWMNIMPYFKNLHSTELPTTENFRVTKLNTSGAIEVLPLQKLVLFFFLQVSQETLLLLCRRHRSGNNGIRSRICTLMRAPSPELFQCQTLTTKLFSELQYYYYVLY